ncbi:MAG: CpaD family pilus assembly lipoprotein [Pseudomonadota bacterium]
MKNRLLLLLFLTISACSAEPKLSKNCPDWSSNPKYNYSNSDFSNFGCAYHNNLSAQVVDKNDLEKGNGDKKSNGDRESVNLQKYEAATPQAVTTISTSR